MSDAVRALLAEGARERVFEQSSVAVVRSGKPVLNIGEEVFDVASVTKVLTAVLALRHFELNDRTAIGATVGELLSHSSGLRAWAPYFAMGKDFEGLLANEKLTASRPTYSDLGFLALGFELERRTGKKIDRLAREEICKPLGLRSMQWGGVNPSAVRTGRGRPRPGNPPSDIAVKGEQNSVDFAVDDDNAAALDGKTGHAGLWSNAMDLARFGDSIRGDDRLFRRVSGSRTYGLDTPSGDHPAIGTILGKGPKGAAGHLGFTGCSLWIDRDAELSVAFLSNAVAIERPNPRIREFRPRLHDLIAQM